MSNLIQVGIKILRAPDGSCEKAVGLYLPATPELQERENLMLEELDALKAKVIHDYIEAKKAIKRS